MIIYYNNLIPRFTGFVRAGASALASHAYFQSTHKFRTCITYHKRKHLEQAVTQQLLLLKKVYRRRAANGSGRDSNIVGTVLLRASQSKSGDSELKLQQVKQSCDDQTQNAVGSNARQCGLSRMSCCHQIFTALLSFSPFYRVVLTALGTLPISTTTLPQCNPLPNSTLNNPHQRRQTK